MMMPMEVLTLWQALIMAFVLDMLVGDPQWMPHPIRFMGYLINRLEGPFRSLPVSTVVAGGLFCFCLVGFFWTATWLFLHGMLAIHPMAYNVALVVILYFSIASRCLGKAAKDVETPLAQGDIEKAQLELSMIVSRDTKSLNPMQIGRAAIETVAENFVDGVLSPLFWIVVGGAPAAMAFKMISTLDSMVGYKNAKYLEFGKVSARTDDVANFLPARISVWIISLGAQALGMNSNKAYKTGVGEGRNHKSPNAGYPEAAFAGALEIKLNGPGIYHGVLVEKPYLGREFNDPDVHHITMARHLMLMSSFLGAALAVGASYTVSIF